MNQVHWSNFDCTIQGRVREAMEKIILRGKLLSATSLQEGKVYDVMNLNALRIGYGTKGME